MRFGSLRSVALGLPLLLAVPVSASASGFAIFEQGARGMGFAGAFTAQASDPSAIFHNAAGIAFLKGRQFHLGGTVLRPSSSFEGADPFPGTAARGEGDNGLISIPVLYYTHAVGERLVIGAGLHTPFDLENAWADPDTFSGRFISRRAQIRSVSFNPTVAYKLADRLSVGAALDVRFSSLELSRSVPVFDPFTQKVVDGAVATFASDRASSLGFNLGVRGELNEEWAIGLSYRHKVNAEFEGTGTFRAVPTGQAPLDARLANRLPSGDLGLTTVIEFPAIASAGVAWQRSGWLIETDVNWYQWSTFDVVGLTFPSRPDLSEVLEQHYSNSWQLRIGAERPIDETWIARGGYFFDQTPSPASSVSPILADGNRHGLALGGTWTSGPLRVDAASSYVMMRKRSTDGESGHGFEGIYKGRALTLGVSLGYAF